MQLIVLAFLAGLSGVVAAPYCPVSIAVVTTLVVLGSAVVFHLKNFPVFVCLLVFTQFFLLGLLRYTQFQSSTTDLIDLSDKYQVTAVVNDFSYLTEGRSRADVLVEELSGRTGPFPDAAGLKLRVYFEQAGTPLLPGDLVRFAGRLRRPRLYGSPGEFDWPGYLRSQRIDLTGWLKKQEQLEILPDHRPSWRRQPAFWRAAVATDIQSALPEFRSTLVRALVLGEGRILPTAVRQQLSRAGVSHLFAISGLHLGLLALLAYRLLFALYRHVSPLLEWQPPQRVLPLVLLPLLLFYLLFTGDAVATRRAFAFFALGALFLTRRYHVNPLHLLMALALISLLVNPLLVKQAGWQLSFAGAAGILSWRPWWLHEVILRRPALIRYAGQILLVTLAALVATTPFVLGHFHLFSAVALIANLICVPLISLLILPLGLAGLVFYPLTKEIAVLLFYCCGSALELLLQLISRLSALNGSVWVTFLSRWQVLAVAMAMLAILLLPRCRDRRKKLLLIIPTLVVSVTLWQFPRTSDAPISLTMFSVGQGESLLLQNCLGETVLVDGGGLYSSRFDVGERLLAPALGELGIHRLNSVVLSHDHPDHRKGLIYLLDTFAVGNFYSGHQLIELHPSLQEVLDHRQIPMLIPEPGWNQLPGWHQGQLWLFNNGRSDFNENDQSLALYLQFDADDGVLLTGDLQRQGVSALLAAGLPGPVSLLKLPHHGSRYSLTDQLLDRLNPTVCLVSAGYGNPYHLPSGQVVDEIEQRDIALYRTDEDGTIRVEYRPQGLRVRQWQKGFFIDR